MNTKPSAAAGVDTHPGSAERLKQYWEHGEGAAKIGWGTAGDFDRCVLLVTEHTDMTPEQAKGYCNERHHGATGMWPSQHAKELKGGAMPTTVPQLVTIPDIDLVATGTWDLSSGRQTFTTADLHEAVKAMACPAIGQPVIKLGHIDPRFDGEPAIGKIANIRVNDAGTKLKGDLAGMPGWLAQISASAFPRRSVEGCYDFKCQIGHTHPFVLTGVALLGVAAPGVGVLNDLSDIASLYGVSAEVAAAAIGWEFSSDQLTEGTIMAVTEEDVRRAYYATGGDPSLWITELQMDPTQLIVTDGEKIFRVPFAIAGTAVTFEGAAELSGYAELTAARGASPVVAYATAQVSRSAIFGADNKPYGDVKYADPKNGKYPIDTEAHAKAAWSYINQDKNASQYPMNGVSLQTVKDAIMAACKHFGIDISAAAADPPTMTGDSKTGDVNNASMTHGSYTGTHTHLHAANGSQGKDDAHSHPHTHNGDGDHGHAHATAGAANQGKDGSDVELTDEQKTSLRKSLGLADDAEITPEMLITASSALRESADQKVAAAARHQLPAGVMTVDREAWDNLNKRVEQGEKFRAKKLVDERDEVIAAAIRDGKFSAARRVHWARLWDADPDGTREVLAGLHKNVVPVDDIGGVGGTLDDDDQFDKEFAGLWAPGTFPSKRGA